MLKTKEMECGRVLGARKSQAGDPGSLPPVVT